MWSAKRREATVECRATQPTHRIHPTKSLRPRIYHESIQKNNTEIFKSVKRQITACSQNRIFQKIFIPQLK
jgi:hypothetical protein